MNFDINIPVKSLYIHWPFCPYKCYFCPFVAVAGHLEYMERYHNAVVKELEFFLEKSNKITDLNTIFFGGGTPSTYPISLLLDMFGKLYNRVGFNAQAEISIEVNPGTVNLQKLVSWRDMGINRLSIGVQSKNDAVLKSLNRHQKFADVIDLLKIAESKFDNISVDLILGLPEVTVSQWKEFINEIKNWPIKHISLYFLTIHEDTPLYFSIKKNIINLPNQETIVDLYYWTIAQFESYGLYQYEISNFAKKGYESKHNTNYWLRQPYKGLGLGACSFDNKTRFVNEKNLIKYIEGLEKNENIVIFYETLNEKEVWLEELMLGLRQIKGVFLNKIFSLLNNKQKDNFLKQMHILLESKLLKLKDDYLSLTPAGLSVANEIIVKLSVI